MRAVILVAALAVSIAAAAAGDFCRVNVNDEIFDLTGLGTFNKSQHIEGADAGTYRVIVNPCATFEDYRCANESNALLASGNSFSCYSAGEITSNATTNATIVKFTRETSQGSFLLDAPGLLLVTYECDPALGNFTTFSGTSGIANTFGLTFTSGLVCPESATTTAPETTTDAPGEHHDDDDDKKLSKGAIAGIVIGGLVLLGLIGFLVYRFCIKSSESEGAYARV